MAILSQPQDTSKARGNPSPPLSPLVSGQIASHNSTTSNPQIMPEHVPFQIVTRAARRRSTLAALGGQGQQVQQAQQAEQAQQAPRRLETRKAQRNRTHDDPKPAPAQAPRKRRKTIKRTMADRSPGHSDSTISFDGDEEGTYLYKFGEGSGRSYAHAPRSLRRWVKSSSALTGHDLEEGQEVSDANLPPLSRVNKGALDQSSPSPMKTAVPAVPMGQIIYRENDVEEEYRDLFRANNFDRDYPIGHPRPRYKRADSQETIALSEEYFQSSEAENNLPCDPRDPHSTVKLAKEFDYSVQAASYRTNLKAVLYSRPKPKYNLREELAERNPVKFSAEDWDQHFKEHERY